MERSKAFWKFLTSKKVQKFSQTKKRKKKTEFLFKIDKMLHAETKDPNFACLYRNPSSKNSAWNELYCNNYQEHTNCLTTSDYQANPLDHLHRSRRTERFIRNKYETETLELKFPSDI